MSVFLTLKALESSIETVVKRVRDRLDATGYFSEDYGTISIRSYDHFYLTAEEVTALPTLQMGIDYKDGGYFNNIIPNSKYRQDLWDTIFSVGSLNYHDVDVVEAMKILRASGVPLNMIISILKDMDEDDAITSAVNAGMSKGPLEKKKIEDIVKAVNEHLIDLSDEENKNLLKQQEATGEATPEDKLNHIFNKRNRY